MNKKYTTLLFLLLFLVQTNHIWSKGIPATHLRKIDILNIGSIAYPQFLEERSDIPF